MDELANILDQTRQYAVSQLQGAPSEWVTNQVVAGIGLLLLGIGLSVFGAKFAKAGVTTGFVVLGGSFGHWFAGATNFPELICVLTGALLIGIIGFQTFKLWIGVGAAIVFSSVVMGAFGYNQLLPRVVEYQQTASTVAQTPEGTTNFTIPTTTEQSNYLMKDPVVWAKNFWTFLTDRDVDTANNARAIGVVALLTGLCMGLIAVRLALILATSLVGTSMVSTGLATLMTHSVPDSYHACNKNPIMVGVAVGGFLVTSLVLQTLLSRKGSSDKAESKDHS